MLWYEDFLKCFSVSVLTVDGINTGALVLQGLTVDGLDLLERYVDMSGDVQTASCVIIQALPNTELSPDPRIRTWIESYRGLLDSWRLWHPR